MNPFRLLSFAATGMQYQKFQRDCRAPDAAYARLWRDEIEPLLRRAPFWQRQGLPAKLADCPLTDYGTYAKALERTVQTGISELNGEPVLFFAQSAGTSGPQKLFPLTRSFQRQFQRTAGPFVHALLRSFDGLLRHPVLYFAATAPSSFSPTGVPIGYISHFNYVTISPLLQRQYCIPRAALADAATFAHGAPLYALAQNLSGMLSVTPLSLSGLLSSLTRNWNEYLAILAGEKPMPVALPRPAIDPARLALLRGLDPATFSFQQIWPGLACVACWTSSVCKAQLQQIQPRLGVPVADAIYSATEGWMNVPFGDGVREGGPLHPGAHIVEFLPEGDAAEPRNLLKPWELAKGRNYEVFLTTAQGMVRYRLYDVVACNGMFARAPIISFRYKSGRSISLGLAVVSEAELVSASLSAGLILQTHWRFGPNAAGNGMALYGPEDTDVATTILAAVDTEVRRMNINYARYTGNGTIAPLTVERLPISHPFWQRATLHAQSKPQYLVQAIE